MNIIIFLLIIYAVNLFCIRLINSLENCSGYNDDIDGYVVLFIWIVSPITLPIIIGICLSHIPFNKILRKIFNL